MYVKKYIYLYYQININRLSWNIFLQYTIWEKNMDKFKFILLRTKYYHDNVLWTRGVGVIQIIYNLATYLKGPYS